MRDRPPQLTHCRWPVLLHTQDVFWFPFCLQGLPSLRVHNHAASLPYRSLNMDIDKSKSLHCRLEC